MAYLYSDWMTYTDPAVRLDRARRFHAELCAQMGPDVSSGGNSVARSNIMQMIANLYRQIEEMEAKIGKDGEIVRPMLFRPGRP